MSWGAALGGAASACAVAGSGAVLFRASYRWLNRLEGVMKVVEQRSAELTPGPPSGAEGKSLRDDVSDIQRSVKHMAETVEDLARDFRDHIRSPYSHRYGIGMCDTCGYGDAHLYGPMPLPPGAMLPGMMPAARPSIR